jgi:hypothetical protein
MKFHGKVCGIGLLCLISLATVVQAFGATPAWTLLSTSGLSTNLFRAGGPTVYDPVSNELIIFGGASECCGTVNDVWILSHANGLGGTGAWSNLIANGAAGSPPARYNFSGVYDSANNRMIIFGGCEGGCLPVANDVWVLIGANGQSGTPTWVQLSPSGGPPGARQSHQAVYDPNTNSMIIWGGQNGGGSCGGYSDVWVLSHANGLGGTPAWTQLNPTGGPPLGDYSPSATYDPTHNVLMTFGGIEAAGSCNNNETNAVWTLSNANGTGGQPLWTKLTTNTPPIARSASAAVYNTSSNIMTIFAGTTRATNPYLSDLWVLTFANGIGGTPTWTKQSPTGTFKPVARYAWNTQAIDVANDRMMVTLGLFDEGPLWSTWVLTNEDQ